MLQPTRTENRPSNTAPLLPDAERARLYVIWSVWAGLAFFAVYPSLNWITSLRPHRFHLYTQTELAAPFVPQFIWAYLSMYVLFLMPLFLLPAARMATLGKQLVAGTLLSGLLFLLLPADLGFTRTIPTDPAYAQIYATLFSVDRPHNLVPSLHVVFSTAIILACADVASPQTRGLLYAWLVIITSSTVLVHQHHLLDVAAAIFLVLVLRKSYRVPHV